MEELGIGRPSTYAAILQVLQDRGYMRIDKKRLVPEDKGRVVVAFLESFFSRYVEYDFTASLEEQLDRISNNEIDWREVLRDFWRDFIGAVDEIKDLRIAEVLDALNELLAPHIFPPRADGVDPRQCPSCATGRLSLKLGKFGAFIGCSNYPGMPLHPPAHRARRRRRRRAATRSSARIPRPASKSALAAAASAPMSNSARPPRARSRNARACRRALRPTMSTLQRALALLSLPREVGRHPESGEPILAGIGRFGPYVQHGKTYANLEAGDDVLTVGLNRAVALIAEKVAKGQRASASAPIPAARSATTRRRADRSW